MFSPDVRKKAIDLIQFSMTKYKECVSEGLYKDAEDYKNVADAIESLMNRKSNFIQKFFYSQSIKGIWKIHCGENYGQSK